MGLLSQRVIRSKLDVDLDIPYQLDFETWRGNALKFELAVFDKDGLSDISEVESVNIKVQGNQIEGSTNYMDQTVPFSELNTSLTIEQWQAGTGQHFVFDFTNIETNLSLSKIKKQYWIVFSVIFFNGKIRTLAGGRFVLHEDNDVALLPPQENPGIPITIEQADARYGICCNLFEVVEYVFQPYRYMVGANSPGASAGSVNRWEIGQGAAGVAEWTGTKPSTQAEIEALTYT